MFLSVSKKKFENWIFTNYNNFENLNFPRILSKESLKHVISLSQSDDFSYPVTMLF